MASDTPTRIMAAARIRLLADGYANLSTRRVAETAGVPLSQIHYHFGGRQGMVLSLLAYENQRLLDRQHQMYSSLEPLWKRYEQACDFLDEDLASGYVRVLQEMISAGWSDREVAEQVIALLGRWLGLLEEVAGEAEQRFGPLGPFTAADIGALVGLAFLGAEAVILLGHDGWSRRARTSLRRIGELIRVRETGASTVEGKAPHRRGQRGTGQALAPLEPGSASRWPPVRDEQAARDGGSDGLARVPPEGEVGVRSSPPAHGEERESGESRRDG